jgi:hypothetical protein
MMRIVSALLAMSCGAGFVSAVDHHVLAAALGCMIGLGFCMARALFLILPKEQLV